MSDDLFDESDFDLLASGISEFASHDLSEGTLPPSTRRLRWAIGNVVGGYREKAVKCEESTNKR